MWFTKLIVICLFVTNICRSSKYPESICIGCKYNFIHVNGRYDLVHDHIDEYHNNSLPIYYSTDSNTYLYPLTSNITYYVSNPYLNKLESSNITYYFLSKSMQNYSSSNPHCIFNSTLFNGTFDLMVLCPHWQTSKTYVTADNAVHTEVVTDISFTTYSECLQDIKPLCISNKYHKFLDGTYKFKHWNYTLRGPLYYCSKCDNNGGMYMYPWMSTNDDRYEFKIDDKYIDGYAYEACTLDQKENDNKYIFNVNDCDNLWRSYHDSDWFHDESISILHEQCPFKLDLNALQITLIVIGAIILLCICCCFGSRIQKKCNKSNRYKLYKFKKVNEKKLAEEFEIFKQKEADEMFKDWDESQIDWEFNEDDNKIGGDDNNDNDDYNEMAVKQSSSSTNNVIMVNPYFLVEKGLKECFINEWETHLKRFKNESITDEVLKLIQDLDDEQQNKYLEKVLKSIGDLVKFKQWLSVLTNLHQVEGM